MWPGLGLCKLALKTEHHFIRIRITKQLDIDAEEPLESEGESRSPRRKSKRNRKDSPSLADAMTERVQDAEFVVEAVALPGTNEVLMVEVENVIHEEFQVTEEVKVL